MAARDRGVSLVSALMLSPHLLAFWQRMFPLVAWPFISGICLAVPEDWLPRWLRSPIVALIGSLLLASGAHEAPWANSDVLTASGARTILPATPIAAVGPVAD